MRTEKEIREHRDALSLLIREPCNCAKRGLRCDYQCRMGANLMQSTMDALAWALGSEQTADRANTVIEAAAKIRAKRK